jgi:hypothetical protein
MNDPQLKPKRRFWQIHLSTAILLVFVAASLSYVNTTPHRKKIQMGPEYSFELDQQGWPFEIYDWEFSFGTASAIHRIPIIRKMIFNVLITGLILLPTASLAEWLIRRREGRKT